jgi:hypothetical protein
VCVCTCVYVCVCGYEVWAVACGREFTVITTMSRAACRVLEVALGAAQDQGTPVTDDLIGNVPDSVALPYIKCVGGGGAGRSV